MKTRKEYIYIKAAKKQNREYLKNQKKYGGGEVEILPAVAACDVCKQWKGKRFTVKKALKKSPLPIKGCSNKKYGCRCCYVPVID